MASITYDKACCVYPGADKLAVDSLDLGIEDGEFIVLVGPSGSGKSTALRMLAGLEEIDSGAIHIGGKSMVGVAPKDRDIAMVFQNYALYPNKTVGENMGFALKMRGVPTAERKAKVAEAAKLLDLTDFLDRKPAKLSGGQRQRVAMGRAIVREPQVFCMDEPLSNLDAKLRVQTRTQIAALHMLQQFSTPTELYDRPLNAFVAGFIGSPSMNLFTAPVTDGSVGIGQASVDLDAESEAALRKSGVSSVIVGIRPEHLALADGDSGMDADVALLEELGSETYVYASLADDSIRNLDGEPMTVVVRSPERAPAKRGDGIRLRQADTAVHLFHPETGERLN